jgi:hypothetical protein
VNRDWNSSSFASSSKEQTANEEEDLPTASASKTSSAPVNSLSKNQSLSEKEERKLARLDADLESKINFIALQAEEERGCEGQDGGEEEDGQARPSR